MKTTKTVLAVALVAAAIAYAGDLDPPMGPLWHPLEQVGKLPEYQPPSSVGLT